MSNREASVKPLKIIAGAIFTPFSVIKDASILVNADGRVEYVGPKTFAPRVDYDCISAPDLWLCPGFIDIHTHGGNGVAFGVGSALARDLQAYSQWVAKTGVTGFLATIAGATREDLNNLLDDYAPILNKGVRGARALGLHLEGPFLSVEKKGAFNPKWLRPPLMEEALEYIQKGRGWIRQISIAPELPHAFEVAREFRKAHITVALAHTNSNYDTAHTALMGDFTHVTHAFNTMPEFNHRSPGALGAVLTSDNVSGELIADGIHVHPAAMRLLLRCLGYERICLITDAIPGAGLPDGEYFLIGQKIIVKEGKATLENGTLAGSIVRLNQCVRNIHQLAGASIQAAIQMATHNPARAIGLERQYGMLATGMPADLILIDESFEVHMTMVGGEIVYENL